MPQRSRLFYRARVRGRWGMEQPLVDGDAFSPCAVGDARGAVLVTWLSSVGGRSQVMFMRFSYLSPFGLPQTMSGAADAPGSPVIVGGGIGSSVLVWPDQANGGGLWFARFHPDSGFGPRLPLVPGGFGAPQAVHAALDTSGAFHSVWLLGGPGVSELHYQRRARTSLLPDTTLVSAGGVVQNPRIAVDAASGSAHIVFQRLTQGLSQVCYKRWNPARGWEEGNTELSDLATGTAVRPVVVPHGPANVTVLFTGTLANVPRFMERRRLSELPPAMAVDPPPRPSLHGLRLAPNPLRAGMALRLTLETAAADHTVVDLFDIGGRRVASVAMMGRLGVLPASATAGWPGGIYFARERDSARAARIVFVR
jgi:hypothetical protein